MIDIVRYEGSMSQAWDKIVEQSRNGTFLHMRSYMDYHADRFVDHSLVISRLQKPVAVFPASVHGTTIVTHGGLTYGGLLATEVLGAEETLQAFEAIGDYYRNSGITKITYKPVPYIFHRYPCQEELYALYRAGATLVRRDASSAIALDQDFRYSKGRKWSINKAKKEAVIIHESHTLSGFHELLCSVLKKFDTTPTHSLDELELLKSRFPSNIRLHLAEVEQSLVAGAIVYDFGFTAHTQYLATSEAGRDIGALDFLISHLIENEYASKKYFSFGISTEKQGNFLNAGLIAQKEGFGARTIVHDFYEWNL